MNREGATRAQGCEGWAGRVQHRRENGETVDHSPLERVRRICLGLPEADERLSHGAPTFFVRSKKAFVVYADNHHGDGRVALWCNAPPGLQESLVNEDPGRFFVPPYVGAAAGSGFGWMATRIGSGSRI